MDKQPNSHQEGINELYDWIAHRLIKDKQPKAEVVATLVSQHISEETATDMVEYVANEWKQKKTKKAKRDMIIGGIFCIGGVIASSMYSFEVFWVVVFSGITVFIRGASNY